MPKSDPKTILIADDSPENLTVLNELLQPVYRVRVATSGQKALRIAGSTPRPDLILLDILLPKMQGDELCKKLKSDDKYKNIPVILFTASAIRPSLPEEMKAIGADDCILKPFDPEELLGKVKKFIG